MYVFSRGMRNILTCVIEIAVGVLLLIDPIGFTSKIIVCAGVVMLVLSIWNVVKYFRATPEVAALESSLANGLLFLVIGAFCTFKAEWFVLTFPVLTVIYGVFSLVLGICKIQWAADMFRGKQKYWYVAAIGAAATLVFAILILVNPFSTTQFLWTFIAISLIAEAVIDLVTAVLRGKKISDASAAEEAPKEAPEEADVSEEHSD